MWWCFFCQNELGISLNDYDNERKFCEVHDNNRGRMHMLSHTLENDHKKNDYMNLTIKCPKKLIAVFFLKLTKNFEFYPKNKYKNS